MGGVWWTRASYYVASLDAPTAALNLALSSLTGLTALHLQASAAGLRSREIILKALPRLRWARLLVCG